MPPTTLLTIGGIYALCGIVFHLAFWKIFDWPKSLSKAGFVNRQVTQILNLCLTLVFLFFAVVSLFYQTDLLTTRIGNLLIGFIAFFLLFRLVLQFIYFPIRNRKSKILSVVFFIGFMIYGWLSAIVF